LWDRGEGKANNLARSNGGISRESPDGFSGQAVQHGCDNSFGAGVHTLTLCVARYFRGERRLIGHIEPTNIPNLPSKSLTVQTDGIAALTDAKRSVHVHLDEVTDPAPHFVAKCAVW
jgi:hypothetical protein